MFHARAGNTQDLVEDVVDGGLERKGAQQQFILRFEGICDGHTYGGEEKLASGLILVEEADEAVMPLDRLY